MREPLKNILTAVFILSIVFISSSYGYEKGQIDMHGGKGDKLTAQGAFGVASTLGSVLNKKGSDKQEVKTEENKKFMKIEKIEEIGKEETK